MKALETIIKVRKKELDEKKTQLLEKEGKRNMLLQHLSSLRAKIKNEQDFIKKSNQYSDYYPNYFQRNRDMIVQLYELIKIIDKDIDLIRSEINSIFIEYKRFEIALNKKIEQQRLMLQKSENITMDEIGLNNYLRSEAN